MSLYTKRLDRINWNGECEKDVFEIDTKEEFIEIEGYEEITSDGGYSRDYAYKRKTFYIPKQTLIELLTDLLPELKVNK